MSKEPKIANCPLCQRAPSWISDYDERSGWGDPNKGYISCQCGLTLGAPLPSSPYPKLLKSDAVRKWNEHPGAAHP